MVVLSTRSISDIIRFSWLLFYLFADDHHLYKSATPAMWNCNLKSLIQWSDVSRWIFNNNKLKLNYDNNTEFLLVGSQSEWLKVVHNSTRVCVHIIMTCSCCKTKFGIWIYPDINTPSPANIQMAYRQIFFFTKFDL